jgi:hypothetical protein
MMRLAHYKGAQGILFSTYRRSLNVPINTNLVLEVYDASFRRSFEELTRWFLEAVATYVHASHQSGSRQQSR